MFPWSGPRQLFALYKKRVHFLRPKMPKFAYVDHFQVRTTRFNYFSTIYYVQPNLWKNKVVYDNLLYWLTLSNYQNTQFFRLSVCLSVCHAKGVTFSGQRGGGAGGGYCGQERLNSNSRVAFDHQIVIIIIMIMIIIIIIIMIIMVMIKCTQLQRAPVEIQSLSGY